MTLMEPEVRPDMTVGWSATSPMCRVLSCLVAVYPGRNPKLKAILLLAHLDVVEAALLRIPRFGEHLRSRHSRGCHLFADRASHVSRWLAKAFRSACLSAGGPPPT